MDPRISIIRRLREATGEAVILVEGRSDRAALAALGIPSRIISHPVHSLIESLQTKTVIILTDHDTHGRRLHRDIKHACIHHGIRVNDHLRRAFFRIFHVSHVEDARLPMHVLDILKAGDWLEAMSTQPREVP